MVWNEDQLDGRGYRKVESREGQQYHNVYLNVIY